MCGIAGIVSVAPQWEAGPRGRMLELQRHRGPDGEGEWTRPPAAGSPAIWLGHRRLAIIDLSAAAAQPMSNEDGSLWITYNGEIYNYLELMHELEGVGRRFRTRSDTEVILQAYEQWGDACVDRLNGMFAFAMWDERRRVLFAARDRFGEKPFHYAWNPITGFFAFASEIKALLALPEVDASRDERALFRFVAFQELAGSEQTMWRGVRRLLRAHALRLSWRDGRLTLVTRRYWDVDLDRVEDVGLDQAAERFADLFADSVRLRLRSDVAVGTSLSGGLDSSAVVCQIRALGAAGGQKAFSARMTDPALDEGAHIQTVLMKTGVDGREVWPSAGELRTIFPSLCYHLEEPFLSTSQFAQHLVMRLASAHRVTVLLDGQGADELMAGYTAYFLIRYGDLAERWCVWTLWQEQRGFRARHPSRFPLSGRACAARLFPAAYAAIRRDPSTDRRTPNVVSADMASWWSPDWLAEFRDEPAPSDPVADRDRLTRRLYSDAFDGELQELLRYGDRNSMAWSRELRQPFLDHRLAELLFALPVEHKLRDGETKVILRTALKSLLPESIRRRQDKLGYQTPLASWIGSDLREWAAEHLEQTAAQVGGTLRQGAADALEPHRADLTEDAATALFSLLTLGECLARMRAVASAPVLAG